MTSKLSKSIASMLNNCFEKFKSFDKIIVYYDNGQIELTKILTSIFNVLFFNVEFRKVRPADYKLFQIADLVCTLELLNEKRGIHSFSRSELEFFSFRKGF